MSELTLKAVEQLLDAKLQPIKTGMALLATQESVNELAARLTTVETTLADHTTTLDGLAKDVKRVLDEKTVSAARFERLEKWAQQVGQKLDIKLEV